MEVENRRTRFALGVWYAACAGVVVVTACEDPRMPVKEFLAMQEAAPAASQPASQPAEISSETVALIDEQLSAYKVGPGDVLRIVLSVPDTTGLIAPVVARVSKQGAIELPIVGSVPVQGMELGDVESTVRKAFVPKVYRDASVHIEVVSAENTNVMVIGAVLQPGLIPLRRTERNLLFAISAAGGAADIASGHVTLRRLRRPGEQVTLNLRDPEELQAALALAPLENGDIVKVQAATPNTVFVGGLVNASHPQVYPAGVKVTVLQALAAAGGLRTDITPREATLIRSMADGHEVQVKLDLDRVMAGKDPNLALAAGDILWVPYTTETRVQEWVNRNIFFRAGATVNAGYNANYNTQGLSFMNDTASRNSNANRSSGSLMDQYDPFGFLLQNQSLQSLQQAANP